MKVCIGKGTSSILYSLNRLLHEFLACAPAIILITFFCKVKIFPLWEELSQNLFSYFMIECKYA
jgi:hypothetical protein